MCSGEPLTVSQQELASELETVPNGTLVEYTTGDVVLIMQGTPKDGLITVLHDLYGNPHKYGTRYFAHTKSVKELHLPSDRRWQSYMRFMLAEAQVPSGS